MPLGRYFKDVFIFIPLKNANVTFSRWLGEGGYMGGGRVGYSPGAREPGSQEIFRLTQNFVIISRYFGANLTSRSVFPVK